MASRDNHTALGRPVPSYWAGVPDLAANGNPASGYVILVDGQRIIIGGTCAVAPRYAALIALCNEQLGLPLGFLHSVLYNLAPDVQTCSDTRIGDNAISGRHGAYPAASADYNRQPGGSDCNFT